jgi:hypothetical protein
MQSTHKLWPKLSRPRPLCMAISRAARQRLRRNGDSRGFCQTDRPAIAPFAILVDTPTISN